MKLSIFTTTTNPQKRGDNYKDALNCYRDLADELVIIDGSTRIMSKDYDIADKVITSYWPTEFSWEFIGQQFQKGYEECTGNWVIHADLDFIFHERDLQSIRNACERWNDRAALSFWKYQFILPDRYNLKSRLVIAVNKARFGNNIRFDSGGDLCQPSLYGRYIDPIDVPEAEIPLYNYEKILKTEIQIKNDAGRMARAWKEYFGEYKLAGPEDDSAYDEWLKMVLGRFTKPSKAISLQDHPKYVQETIKSLKPEQWGYNGFGNLEKNNYVK